jgi:hypothetical protein
MCSACFPRSDRPADASLPSTGSSEASSPASAVLSRRYDFLPPIPPHFVAFAWRYLARPLVIFAPRRTSAPPRPGVVDPVSRPGSRGGDDRISQVPGDPRMSVRHVQSTPAGLRAPDHYGVAARPLGSQKQGLPRTVFRRSIAWLSGSLSTLRGTGYPRPAQDSLPAAGQALLDGLSTRRVPLRGFRGSSTSHPPLPSLPGAM